MRKVGWILVGVILFASMANGIRLYLRDKEVRESAEMAYYGLKPLCAKGTPIPARTSLDPLFEVLLSSPYGHAYLKNLAGEFPSLAFHAGRNAVFYLAFEPMNPDGTVDSAFFSYASVHKGPDPGRYSAGARFPPSILFRRVAVDGEMVLVEFEVPKTEKKPVAHDGFSFEPGTAYVTRMDVAALLNPEKPATRVYEEFFPKAKKK